MRYRYRGGRRRRILPPRASYFEQAADEARTESGPATGWVYLASNSSMPGYLKIGCTLRDPRQRLAELSSTGVPHPFILKQAFLVSDAKRLESLVHRRLSAHRANSQREFFTVDISTAEKTISDAALSFGIEIVDRGVSAKSLGFAQRRQAEEQEYRKKRQARIELEARDKSRISELRTEASRLEADLRRKRTEALQAVEPPRIWGWICATLAVATLCLGVGVPNLMVFFLYCLFGGTTAFALGSAFAGAAYGTKDAIARIDQNYSAEKGLIEQRLKAAAESKKTSL